MKIINRSRSPLFGSCAGSTMMEGVFAIMVVLITMSGSINGYVSTATRAEWSAYNLAAHSLAMQRMEQTRAAKWDTMGFPVVDQVVQANFPPRTEILDVPIRGTNYVVATVTTTVTDLSAIPPLKMVRVDCVWPFLQRGPYTNTVISYRAPDQ
jgi:hypothetical protein